MGFLKIGDQRSQGSLDELRDNKFTLKDALKGIENHSYDLSTRDALNTLNALKDRPGGLSARDMGEAIAKLADGGQVTREEFMDLQEWVKANYDKLTPDAKEAFDKFSQAYQKAGGDFSFKDGLFDGGTRLDAILKGPALDKLLNELGVGKTGGKKGTGDAGEPDGVDTKPPANEGSSNGSPTPKSPSEAGGSKGTKRADGADELGDVSGMSIEQIIFAIMRKLEKKEANLKQQLKDLANKIDTDAKNGTKGSGESDNLRMQEISQELKKLSELTQMCTNVLAKAHETTSAIIAKI